ncbi:MAG: sterol desaturase family protein [Candidatus Binatia bacterium]
MLDAGEVSAWFFGWLARSPTVAFYSHPVFWLSLAAILCAERWMPARPAQAVFSKSLFVDATYVVITHGSALLIQLGYLGALRWGYDRWLGSLTVEAAAAWPFAVAATVGILFSDFFAWVHHWVRHRVAFFWRFHAVHHAQRELNAFTDLRYHPFEYLVTNTITALPMFAFGGTLPGVAAWAVASQCYTKLIHANVRTRLGPLRHVLVTPQSHRIHHSVDPEHRDTNYGVVFSVWDRLFGTQHADDDGYPETGIGDERFPDEWVPGSNVLRAPLGHFLYPFRA